MSIDRHFFSCVILCLIYVGSSDDITTLSLCSSHDLNNQSLLLVSSLDGYFSVLNVYDGGVQKWSVSTGPGPMLSSSIHNLELSEHSQWVRMIPSLNGNLYKFNGEYIQPIPVNADNLLDSSFQFSDDVIISGGKEVRTYGIDIYSGQVLYECSVNKCTNHTDYAESRMDHDMIVLQRDTQTVRAVEPRTGSERWNFSVGQHGVRLLRSTFTDCKVDFNKESDIDIKVVVPEGLIYAVRKSSPQTVLWKQKLNSPIVNAWSIHGGRLEWMDLFGASYTTEHNTDMPYNPTVYIGMHNKQLYIQESVILQNRLQQSTNLLTKEPPYIPWRPIPASGQWSKSRVGDQRALQLKDEASTTALSVLYASEYVNGNGYFLHVEQNGKVPKSDECEEENNSSAMLSVEPGILEPLSWLQSNETTVEVVIVSLWHWWKEVIVISVATAFILNCILFRYLSRVTSCVSNLFGLRTLISLKNDSSKDYVSSGRDSGVDVTSDILSDEVKHNSASYKSRYLEDFEPVHVLGKGGFGVVFEARNKIDDCHYAIKRITLPSRKAARERVMREVRALAKLEHQNIVRYFNAWQECPPAGWQEEQDKLWRDKTREDYLSSVESNPVVLSGSVDARSSEITEEEVGDKDSRSIFRFSINKLKKYVTRRQETNTDSFIVFDAGSEKVTESNKISSNCGGVTGGEVSSDGSSACKQQPEGRFSKSRSENAAKISPRIYLYIQMQLCQKDSLKEWLRDTSVRDQSIVLRMFDQIVQAVEYVHLQGLIHRDLKPSNIFFSPEGQIKVGDFGLVTEMAETTFSMEGSDQNVEGDRHTTCVGTELYMSPEQLCGKPYNYKVDIYSLGVILFELLTPFSTQMERYETLMSLRNCQFPSNFSSIHNDEYDLLKLMLSSDPERRPTTYGIKSRNPLKRLHSDSDAPPLNRDWMFELPLKNVVSSKNENFFYTLPYANNCEINIDV